jgi:predicted dehydrogenase
VIVAAIENFDMLEVGFIGDRNHANRLINLVEKSDLGQVSVVFHPFRIPDLPGGTSEFSDLLACDAIFISSPNTTHFDYLKKLSAAGCSGYILCEKPPVTTLEQLTVIERFDGSRLFFNYNFRHSHWAHAIKRAIEQGHLGDIIHADINWTHGLAFKESYAGSWRADRGLNLHGVLETVAIHAVDLLSQFLGDIVDHTYIPSTVASPDTAYDTCLILTQHSGGATASILASYAAPLELRISITGTNGTLVAEDGRIIVRNPRDTFDDRGFFIQPPVVTESFIDNGLMYLESLEASVNFFLDHCAAKRPLPSELFTQSIATNRLVLEIGKSDT